MTINKKLSLEEYPDILTAKELAAFLGLSYSKTLELCKSGNIPCIRVGHVFKIPKMALSNWLSEPGYREYD